MGTHYQGDERTRRALDAYIKLSRAHDTLMQRNARFLAEHDLTISQFGVLEVLFHLGPQCQKDIGNKLLKSRGNITTVADNLERRGLVERRRSEQDRRFVTVHLTREGRALIEALFPDNAASIRTMFGVLTDSEQELLGLLCKKLGLANQDT